MKLYEKIYISQDDKNLSQPPWLYCYFKNYECCTYIATNTWVEFANSVKTLDATSIIDSSWQPFHTPFVPVICKRVFRETSVGLGETSTSVPSVANRTPKLSDIIRWKWLNCKNKMLFLQTFKPSQSRVVKTLKTLSHFITNGLKK